MLRQTAMTALVVSLLAGPIAFVRTAAAQNPTTRPAAAAAAGAREQVVVESVTGVASKRLASDPNAKWERIKVKDALDVLTIIRTGLGAEVVLRFGRRGRVTVGAATKVGIGEYLTKGALMKAQLGLKYGSVGVNVDSRAGENDFTVATPVATLSVRGTAGPIHFGGAFGLNMRGTSGIWNVAGAPGTRNVFPREATNTKLTRAMILSLLRRSTRMGGAVDGGLTPEQIMNLIRNGGGRGIFNFGAGGRVNMWLFGESPHDGQIEPDPESPRE